MREYFAEILDSLRKNRLRTALTGFSIVWGILMFTVLLGLSNGLRNGILDQFGSQLINSGEVSAGYTSESFNGYSKYTQVVMTEKDMDMLRHDFSAYIDNITAISYSISSDTIRVGKFQTIAGINASMPEYLKISGEKIRYGRNLNSTDEREGRKNVVIDNMTAKSLFPDSNPVGEYIDIKGIPFRIVGVINERSEQWWSSPRIYIPLSTGGRMFNSNKLPIHTIFYTFRDGITPDNIIEFEQKAKARLLALHGLSPHDRSAFWLNNVQENMKELNKVISILNIFIWIIGCGTLAAGVIGISNIMIVIVKERTTEIGIRKSIGASPGSIVRMILFEAITITALFGYIGMFIGVAVMEAASKYITLKSMEAFEDLQKGMSMIKDPTLDMSIILSATIILIVAGLLAGYIPAKRAARIKTIDALRGEK